MKLNVPGEEYVIASDQFLEYTGEHLPEKIVFVGGGYISLEFAHVRLCRSKSDHTPSGQATTTAF